MELVTCGNHLHRGLIATITHVFAINRLWHRRAEANACRKRRSPEAWNDFVDCFVDDEEVIARIKAKSRRCRSHSGKVRNSGAGDVVTCRGGNHGR
ncbi:hypothetical protein GHK46_12085 [Sinorhizobium medicae]|nr:hypothetical protein [Sinorhizobium medicae]